MQFANFHFVLIFYVTEAGRNCRETTTTDLVGKILLLGIFSGSNMSCNYWIWLRLAIWGPFHAVSWLQRVLQLASHLIVQKSQKRKIYISYGGKLFKTKNFAFRSPRERDRDDDSDTDNKTIKWVFFSRINIFLYIFFSQLMFSFSVFITIEVFL